MLKEAKKWVQDLEAMLNELPLSPPLRKPSPRKPWYTTWLYAV